MAKDGNNWHFKEILIFFLFLILPFGQLIRLPLKTKAVNFYFFDLVVILLLFVWLREKFFFRKKLVNLPLFQPILGFIGFGFFSLLLAFPQRQLAETGVAFLYLARWSVYPAVYFVSRELEKTFKEKVYFLAMVGITFSAFLGLLQYIFIPDVSALKGFNWDPHYFRIIGPFLDPGYAGMVYVLGIIMAAFSLVKPVKPYPKAIKLFLWGSIFLLYLALALTYSRSSYLAFLTAMAVVSWGQKSAKIFIFSLLLFLVTVFLLPRPGGEGVKLERKSTIFSRLGNWQTSSQIIANFPLFGVGFNNLRYIKRDYGFLNPEKWQVSHSGAGLDNSLLFVWATTGILGLLCYFWLGAKIFNLSLKKKNKLVLACLLALLSHSVFNNSLFYAWLMLYFWLILGLGGIFKEYKSFLFVFLFCFPLYLEP